MFDNNAVTNKSTFSFKIFKDGDVETIADEAKLHDLEDIVFNSDATQDVDRFLSNITSQIPKRD